MSSNGSRWQGREVVIVEAARTPIGRGHAEMGDLLSRRAANLARLNERPAQRGLQGSQRLPGGLAPRATETRCAPGETQVRVLTRRETSIRVSG
jgi:hypothetical protein